MVPDPIHDPICSVSPNEEFLDCNSVVYSGVFTPIISDIIPDTFYVWSMTLSLTLLPPPPHEEIYFTNLVGGTFTCKFSSRLLSLIRRKVLNRLV